MKLVGYLTDVSGFSVGHYTDSIGITGCSVIICPESTVGGVFVCGGSPATREIAIISQTGTLRKINALLMVGGSVRGLSAADGVMKYLDDNFSDTFLEILRIPIVPTAGIFDLRIGNADAFPIAEQAYQACCDAKHDDRSKGSIGAGTGATVGKVRGIK